MSSAVRQPGREHMPNYPRGYVVLPIFQLVLALITMGLASYAVSQVAFPGDGLMLFTATMTLGVTIWMVSAHSCAPKAYNYWAVLAFNIVLYILWLVSFSLLAVEAAAVLVGNTTFDYFDDDDFWRRDWYDDDYDSDYYGDDDFYDSNNLGRFNLTYGAVLAAAAGVGAAEFLLFFISLIMNSVMICRHRRAGLHNRPVSHSAPAQMQFQSGPGGNPTYAAVQNPGFPPVGQNMAYNPQGFPSGQQPQQPQQFAPPGEFYNAEQAKPGFYPPQNAMVHPQSSGGSFVQSSQTVTPTPPPQGGYTQPHQPPQA